MRHRFHAICPYFAMFPETFVEKHLAASRFDGVVFDPFCGRGTTLFESLIRGRKTAGCDVNPVAVCITSAKCNPPTKRQLLTRIGELEKCFKPTTPEVYDEVFGAFFKLCFHETTWQQVTYLRSVLNWRSDKVDGFIAALCLGALHGESHRSPNYFSNRMPRTISTKPAYSVRWWQRNNYAPPERDVFSILRNMTEFRYITPPPELKGSVAMTDARKAGKAFKEIEGKVTDVITSPPYLDTTNYLEDQWLRLWFLGNDPCTRYSRDDGRHYDSSSYWQFMTEAWQGIAPLIAERARIVVRVGGRRIEKDELRRQLTASLKAGLGRKVRLRDGGITTEVKRSQANSFRGSKTSPSVEHDFCYAVS